MWNDDEAQEMETKVACMCSHTSQEDSPIGIKTATTSSYT